MGFVALAAGYRRALNFDMAYVKLTLVLNSGSRIGPGKAALLESVPHPLARSRRQPAPWIWTTSGRGCSSTASTGHSHAPPLSARPGDRRGRRDLDTLRRGHSGPIPQAQCAGCRVGSRRSRRARTARPTRPRTQGVAKPGLARARLGDYRYGVLTIADADMPEIADSGRLASTRGRAQRLSRAALSSARSAA